jgi:transglutaminase-like putative cysteine protease
MCARPADLTAVRFDVVHETRYTYTMPVSLGPHVLRLRPREDGAQRILSFSIELSPQPSLLSNSVDAEGNAVIHAWFLGTTDLLRITSSFSAEVLRANPFDYVPDLTFGRLPATYGDSLARMLAPYRDPPTTPEVIDFARSVAARAEGRPLAFLDALNYVIHHEFARAVRDDGGPARSAVETLRTGTGACRDLTVLFIEAARSLGFAARFVSGYRRGDLSRPDRHLHAWPEVFIPGGGWRGWDPVEGLAVADAHVALAAAARQADTMPVEGTFYGTDATSKLFYRLQIQTAA